MSAQPLIQIDKLTKRFGDVTALNEVSLEIGAGRIVGLVGANGGGKSTLLRHMVGLYLPDRGACHTFGTKTSELSPEDLSRIGYVHQEGSLIDWMTPGQLIRYVAAYYPTWNHDLEKEFVERFELPPGSRVGTMSPGQRQKLAILLAIGFDPELLVLDEPAAALDPLARHQFLELLLEIIQHEGRTILISSHILSDVEKVIDHVLILDKGRLLRDCPFDELREEFFRVRLTSLNGSLPKPLDIRGAVDCEQSERQAVVTMNSAYRDELDKTAQSYNCDVEVLPVSFEETYAMVVRGKPDGGDLS
jgi:ABC-2 type transport system ATP-binding protein